MTDIFKCGNCKLIFVELFKFIEHKSQCTQQSRTSLINVDGMTNPSSSSSIVSSTPMNCHNSTYNPTVISISHGQSPPREIHQQHQLQHPQQQLMQQHDEQQQQFQQGQNQQELLLTSNFNNIIDVSSISPSSPASLWVSHSSSPVNEIKPLMYTSELQSTDVLKNIFIQDAIAITDIKPELKYQLNISLDPSSIIDYRTTLTITPPPPPPPPTTTPTTDLNNITIKKPKKIRNKKIKMEFDPNNVGEAPAPTRRPVKVKPLRVRKRACELSRSYQCKICGRSFRRNKLKGHMQIHLVWPDTLQANIGTGNFDELLGIYRCNYCPERIDTFKKLRTHMHSLHKNVKLYMCPMSECRQLFAYQDLIIEHSKWCSFKSTIQCPICYQYFNVIRELEIHILEHKNEILNDVKAQHYPSEKLQSQPIKIAVEMISKSTNLNTENIGENTTATNVDGISKDDRMIPYQIGADIDGAGGGGGGGDQQLHPYQCPICFVKHGSQIMLLKHLHKDSHEHKCDVCQKMFRHKRALTMHLHTHRDLRCICPICNRSFKMPKILNTHMLTHTQREFICDLCGTVTTLKSSLARHFRTHNKPVEKCGVSGCKRIFRRIDCLKAHRILHERQVKRSGTKVKIKKLRHRRYSNSSDSDENLNLNDNNNIKVKKIKKRRTSNLKKNFIIPGIVIEGGKIIKGGDILKEYTILGNNNNNNVVENITEIISEPATEQISLKHNDDCPVVTDDYNHPIPDDNDYIVDWLDDGYLSPVNNELEQSVNNFIIPDDYNNEKKNRNNNKNKEKKKNRKFKKINGDNDPITNGIDMNSNGKDFEFVECVPEENNYTVSVSIERLPTNITNKYLSKIKTNSKPEPEHNEHNEYLDNLLVSTPIKPTESSADECTSDEFTDNIPISELRECSMVDGPWMMSCGEQNEIPVKPKRKYVMTNRRKKQPIVKKPKRVLKVDRADVRPPPPNSKWPVERIHLFITRLSVKTKTTVRTFECNICGRHFKASGVHNHVHAHRVWSFTKKTHIGNATFDSTDKLYRCPYCPAAYKLHPPLRSHMVQNHFNEKLFVCPLSKCQQLFVDDHEFLEHCRECVFNSKDNVRCTICYRFFISDIELNEHKIMAHQMVDNTDPDADERADAAANDDDDDDAGNDKIEPDKKSETNSMVDRQLNGSIPICKSFTQNKFKCDICHATFKNRILLVKHTNRDSHDHKCIYCGKEFLSLRRVRRHYLTHRDVPKMCYICGKIFSVQAYLNSHVLRHTKCHTCDICQKMFARKEILLKHIKRHGDPLYACTHTGCRVVYRRKELIEKHIEKHNAVQQIVSENEN